MKILMIGLGSIGQRHLRNIRKLYGTSCEILAYRTRGLQRTFTDEMQIRNGVNLEEEFKIKVFNDLNYALEEKPDIAFVTNITARHMECAIAAARAGCDLFIEKPVSDSLDRCREFAGIIENSNCIVYVGYQNRFHPCIADIKNIINGGGIGSIISVENEFGERLSTMHPYEDYRTTYMAQKKMGGGPILNLQIHCLDYLQCIFGSPESVFAVAGTASGLDIDVEDNASSLYCFRQKKDKIFPIYSHTDFLQYPPVHKVKVVGEKGRIEADLNAAITKIYADGPSVQILEHKKFARNDMFVKEIQEFMECVKERRTPESDFRQGILSLKMALAAKKSAEENRLVYLEEF